MHNFAFVGNDRISADFLGRIVSDSPPSFIITGGERRRARGGEMIPSPLKNLAEEHGIRVLSTDDPNSPVFLDSLNGLSADFFIVFSFGYYLKDRFLSLPKRMCVNIHPSLLPKLRGAAPVNRSIMNGESSTGVTFFKMTSKMDAGPVIMQRRIDIKKDMTSEELFRDSIEAASEMFLSFDWSADFKTEKQDDSGATHASKIEKVELFYSSRWTALKANRMINGLSEHGVRALFRGRRIKMYRSILASETGGGENDSGSLRVSEGRLKMECREGSIFIEKIQPEGKNAVSGKEFINGMRIKNGEKICAEYSE